MNKLPRKPRQWGRKLVRWTKKIGDTTMVMRAQTIDLISRGRTVTQVSDALGCARSYIYKNIDRYLENGREGLYDERWQNGQLLADADFHNKVQELVSHSPQDYDFLRPTWTRELLVRVAEEQTGIKVSLTVMGRVLKSIGARRGRPKPIVICPLSNRQKSRRLGKIKRLIDNLPAREVVVYEDEVDIHLNPKIGLDWMSCGQQKTVVTPGQNEKAYIAGSLDARDGTVLWVGDVAKNSSLFVKMLDLLDRYYRHKKRIHVILDNYVIHKSYETHEALKRLPRIRLHFLPPYCPDHNKIERLWQELHANVTRNHRHQNMFDLCREVARYLDAISPWLAGASPSYLKMA